MRVSAYTINRSPTKALQGDTPANIWYGKTDLKKLRVFGSKAWCLILSRPGKLEPRARPMRMVGYCGSGYRLWYPMTNEIIESRDVRFEEQNYKFEESTIYDSSEQNGIEEGVNKEENTEKLEETSDENVETRKESQRTQRQIKLPKRFDDYDMSIYAYALLSEDPTTYKEAIQQEDWSNAIQKELEAHKQLGTWVECDLPNITRQSTPDGVFEQNLIT